MSITAKASVQLVCAIAVVGCLGLIVAVVSIVAEDGYHPARHVGGLDVARAGMIVLFLAGVALSGLWATGAILGFRSRQQLGSLSVVLLTCGLTISAVAMLLWVVSMPPSAGPVPLPSPLAAMVRIGLGLAVAGWVLGIVAGVRSRYRGC